MFRLKQILAQDSKFHARLLIDLISGSLFLRLLGHIIAMNLSPFSFVDELTGLRQTLRAFHSYRPVLPIRRIQFGRHFESDFAFSLVRLEAARLHMMRWGVSIGIGVEPFDPEELAGLPADDVETATEILHQIKRTFEAARETSESFKRRQIGILSPTSSATTSSHIL